KHKTPREESTRKRPGVSTAKRPEGCHLTRWNAKEPDRDPSSQAETSIASQWLGPGEPNMSTLCTRKWRGSASTSSHLRFNHDLHLSVAEQMNIGPPMFSPTPVLPEQGRIADR